MKQYKNQRIVLKKKLVACEYIEDAVMCNFGLFGIYTYVALWFLASSELSFKIFELVILATITNIKHWHKFPRIS